MTCIIITSQSRAIIVLHISSNLNSVSGAGNTPYHRHQQAALRRSVNVEPRQLISGSAGDRNSAMVMNDSGSGSGNSGGNAAMVVRSAPLTQLVWG